MRTEYKSPYKRLARLYPNKLARLSVAMIAVQAHFNGFDAWDGYDPDYPETLTPAQDKQIRRYYNILHGYTEGGPTYKMPLSDLPPEVTTRRDIDKVMYSMGMRYGRKRARYIFAKHDGETIPEIKITSDGIPVFVNKKLGYEREFIPLPSRLLAESARATVTALTPHCSDTKNVFFRVASGQHEIARNYATLGALATVIEELQQKYKIGTRDAWTNWLTGVYIYRTERPIAQTSNDIAKAKAAYRKKIKLENARLKAARKKSRNS